MNDIEPRSLLPEGTLVGRYRIISRLGSGGMGDVYLAEDKELKRQIALKLISPTLGANLSSRTRFIREAQAAARLSHPNIVTIHEVGEFKGRPYIAMEFVEGESLRELIERDKLPLAQVLKIGIQICEGLQEAHIAGIVHRDIKPANILIDRRGQAKLLDFGLAAMQGAQALTKSGSTLGTVNYMSPEQVLGKNADARSDIFSLGIVLYEMISGRLPFHGDIEAVVMYAIANEGAELLSKYRPDIPDALQKIVDRALQKQPTDRYQSASEIATDLGRLMGDSSGEHYIPRANIGRRRSSRPHAPVSFIKKKITFAAMATLIIAAIIILSFVYPFGSSGDIFSRVVVAPFINQTGDPAIDPLGRMMADWTTQGLAQSGWIEAIPPEALSDVENKESIQEIVRATGANVIVLGSYYLLGDSIRIQAKVVDANNRLLQAIEPVSSRSAESMEAVEGVRQRVMGALAVVANQRLDAGLMNAKPPTYEAYQQYIRGYDLLVKYPGSEKSLKYFEKAYSIDTTYMLSLLYVAIVQMNVGRFALADSVLQFLTIRRDRLTRYQQLMLEVFIGDLSGDNMKSLTASREAAKIALDPPTYYMWGIEALGANLPRECIRAIKKIDQKHPRARAWVYNLTTLADAFHLIGDYRKEVEAAKLGRELFPDKVSIFLLQEIQALASRGKMEDLKKALDEVAEYDRGIYIGYSIRIAARELRAHGYEDAAMGVYEQAIRWYEDLPAEEMKSRRFEYATALYEARKWQQARIIFEELAGDSPENIDYNSIIGCVAAREGNKEKASEISQWLGNIRQPYLFGTPSYCRARIAAILGDKKQAVSFLEDSARQGQFRGSNRMMLHLEFDFESLRDYPPFQELIKPLG